MILSQKNIFINHHKFLQSWGII